MIYNKGRYERRSSVKKEGFSIFSSTDSPCRFADYPVAEGKGYSPEEKENFVRFYLSIQKHTIFPLRLHAILYLANAIWITRLSDGTETTPFAFIAATEGPIEKDVQKWYGMKRDVPICKSGKVPAPGDEWEIAVTLATKELSSMKDEKIMELLKKEPPYQKAAVSDEDISMNDVFEHYAWGFIQDVFAG